MPSIGELFTIALRQSFAGAIEDEKATLTQIAAAAKSDFTDTDGGGTTSGLPGVLATLLGLVTITNIGADTIKAIISDAAGGGGDPAGFGIGYYGASLAFLLGEPYTRQLQHAIEDLAQSQIADPQTAAAWEAAGLTWTNTGASDAAGGGWDGKYYAAYLESARNYPPPEQLLTLLNLAGADPAFHAEFSTAMERHGIPAYWRDQMLTLARQRLPPAELALAVLRGVMDKQVGENYAVSLGVTPEDFTTLTDNTGEPPGLMQIIEMWRRGIIQQSVADPTVPSLENGIRYSRVRSDWIPYIEKLRYEPITTADAVRAVVENQLAHDDGAAVAAQNGVSADDFTILVNSWGRPPSHEQMMKAHRLGVLNVDGQPTSLDDVAQAIRESDIKNKYVGQIIGIDREVIPQRTIVMMLEHGAITSDEALTKLHEAGYTDADAALIVKLGTTARTGAVKHLSRTDIIVLYENAALDHDSAVKELVALGYTQDDANDVLRVADLKVAASLRKQQITRLHASWKTHQITDPEAIDRLQAIGLDHSQAQNILLEWGITQGVPTRTLTEAQIVKAGKDQIIQPPEVAARLGALGYDQADVNILMQLAGLVTL